MLAPSSALPIGMERNQDEKAASIIKIDSGDILLHSILAISHSNLQPLTATEKDEVNLPYSNVAGFIYVARVDEKKRRMFVLSPTPGKLPKRYLWFGTLRWAES